MSRTDARLQRSEMRPAAISPELFKEGMRRLAGVCTIVTSTDFSDGHQGWVGLTATAISSVTAEPPRVLVCVNRSVLAHQTIVRAGVLGINVLAAENGLALANRFGGGGCRDDEKFMRGQWMTGMLGVPLLADALVNFECTIVDIVASSTHDIIICEVVGTNSNLDCNEPLIYFDGSFKLPDYAN